MQFQAPRMSVTLLLLCLIFPIPGTAIRTALAAQPPLPAKPNILFLFSDDQCFQTIHALGQSEIKTPNLDRLVRAGTTLTHAYNMGSWSGAVCIPSRTMLNTGRFLWPVQELQKSLNRELDEQRLWAPQMHQAGYTTYFTGKWHLNIGAEKVFDVARHIRGGMPQQTDQGYHRPVDGQPDPWNPSDPKFGGFWEGGKHWSEVVGDDACDYLADAAKSDQPFFMYIAFNAPHDPRQSPKEYVDRYPAKKIQVPKNFLPEYPHKDAIGSGKNLRDEMLAPFPRTPAAVQVHRREYYAIITHMDEQIGRILHTLEQLRLTQNTIILFTSDHGLAVGQHGLIGKQNLYDHSVRVPLIVSGPGIPKGKKLNTPVYLQDVMPTSLQLAGVTPPDWVQFNSLLPLLRGATNQSAYDAIYGAYLNLQRSVTFENYKLILYPKISIARLYNLRKDPLEKADLASHPDNRPRMIQLFAKLQDLQRQMGDELNLNPAFPDLH